MAGYNAALAKESSSEELAKFIAAAHVRYSKHEERQQEAKWVKKRSDLFKALENTLGTEDDSQATNYAAIDDAIVESESNSKFTKFVVGSNDIEWTMMALAARCTIHLVCYDNNINDGSFF